MIMHLTNKQLSEQYLRSISIKKTRPDQSMNRNNTQLLNLSLALIFIWACSSVERVSSSPIIVEPITQLDPIIVGATDHIQSGNTKYEERVRNNSMKSRFGSYASSGSAVPSTNENNDNSIYNSNENANNNNNWTTSARLNSEIEPLQLIKIVDPEVTCNDGSPIGYYMRLNNYSKSWLIYLEGGGFCGSEQSCQRRWQRTPEYMSSDYWPSTRTENGILSNEPTSNPYLWNANHIYIGYCTSDSYSGLRSNLEQVHAQSLGSDSLDTSGGQYNNRLFNKRNSVNIGHNKRNTQENPNRQQYSDNQQYGQSDNHNGNSNNNQQSASGSSYSFSFMGSRVVERVLESLFENLSPESSLYQAKSILLAGESAGAAGVMLNLDKMRNFIRNKFVARHELQLMASVANGNFNFKAPKLDVPTIRGLADSGWFVDNELDDFEGGLNSKDDANIQQADSKLNSQFRSSSSMDSSSIEHSHHQQLSDYVGPDYDCEQQTCSSKQTIIQAMSFWRGQVPSACSNEHPNEPWLCYFGYRTYRTLESPLFVVQWLYDDYQLVSDKLIPASLQQRHARQEDFYWQNIRKVGQQVRRSLENVTALFAPSCLSHSMITKQSWNQIYVNGFRLPHVLNRWEEQSLGPEQQQEQHNVEQLDSVYQAQTHGFINPTDNDKQVKRDQQITNFKLGQHGKVVSNRSTFEHNNNWASSGSGRTHNANPAQLESTAHPRSKASVKKKRRNGQTRSRLVSRVSTAFDQQDQLAKFSNPSHHQNHHNNQLTPQSNDKQPHQSTLKYQSSLNVIRENANLGPFLVSSDESSLMFANLMPDESNQFSGSQLSLSPITAAPVLQQQQPNLVSPNGWYLVEANNSEQNPLRLLVINPTRSKSELIDRKNKFRLIDSCAWPQCNRDCPTLNPYLHSRPTTSWS